MLLSVKKQKRQPEGSTIMKTQTFDWTFIVICLYFTAQNMCHSLHCCQMYCFIFKNPPETVCEHPQ